MADFTQTISNAINVFGASPTNKYGSSIWGQDKWAFDSRAVVWNLERTSSNTVTLTDSVSLQAAFNLSIANAIEINADSDLTGSLVLSDGRYDYEFSGGTNADRRTSASYTAATAPSDSYTEVTRPDDTWTEV